MLNGVKRLGHADSASTSARSFPPQAPKGVMLNEVKHLVNAEGASAWREILPSAEMTLRILHYSTDSIASRSRPILNGLISTGLVTPCRKERVSLFTVSPVIKMMRRACSGLRSSTWR